MKSDAKKMSVKTLALGAILTALVVILQFMGSFVHIGIFSISLVLIPIVIGAAMCGKFIGAWLGFVFGVVVLISGDAAAFLAVNIPGTVITVLLKGTLCGLFSGLTYDLFARKNQYLGVFAAAIVCPIVNTGIFLLGCLVFFMPVISSWAGDTSLVSFMIFGLGLINFPVELAFNLVLSPVIVRLLKISKRLG
ncbi:MAG: ECF transporter S component [Oscillospiraceae bacterium]|nr:ECF transporter S component [Oscillospiraceae bacterium]